MKNKMKIIFMILSLFLSYNIIAQPKTLIFVIDTVILESKKDGYRLTLKPCGDFFSNEDFFLAQEEISLDKYPNYINRVDSPNGITTIELPIDTSGSFICLMDFYKTNTDTLRINSMTIFNTKPIDSTFTHSYYYKKNNGEMSNKRYKEKSKKEGSDFEPISPPMIIEMTINGIKYKTILKLEKSGLTNVTTGSGYDKKQPFYKNGDYKKKLKYYTYEQRTVQYLWKGVINLKEK